jgi:hypothetical protein
VDPKQTHAWEQSSAAAREFAAQLGIFRDTLRNEGFSDLESLALTNTYMVAMLGTLRRGDE